MSQIVQFNDGDGGGGGCNCGRGLVTVNVGATVVRVGLVFAANP